MIGQLRRFLGTLGQLCLTNSSSSTGQRILCHPCTGFEDTGRFSILSRTPIDGMCLTNPCSLIFAMTEESILLPQGSQDVLPSGCSHPNNGYRNPFAGSRTLCYDYQGWSHRIEFKQMHFLMTCVWDQGFVPDFQGGKKNIAEMHVGLLISEEILFSLAVLLFWDSFFL